MTHHVVVVDDALPTLRHISTIVAHIANVIVHPFTSSAEALDWAKHNEVDAFVVDTSVPAPAALEMVRTLRADARFALVPLIVLSAGADPEVRLAALAAGANDFIARPVEPHEIISRLQTLLALHEAHAEKTMQVVRLEASLRNEERRLRQQADRLAALWRIANNGDLSEDQLMQEILDQSTAALRSGQFFTSSLSRLDGDVVVVEARSYDPDVYRTPRVAPVGTRIPLDDAVQKIVLHDGATRSWDDVMTDPIASQVGRVRALGCRALILTPFAVNRQTFFLTFWSREAVTEPFVADDDRYVELVAKFFAVRLQQSRQSNRLNYQISHDTLTGLRNRTQFRLDARARYQAERCGAVAVVDLAAFSDVNERYGHIIGDALLLEVGTALDQRAKEAASSGAIAARLAGDAFGIFLPGVASRQDAIDGILPFMDALRSPFSTSGGDDPETIALSARCGLAWSADPDSEVDELIAHADTALYAAKRYRAGRIEIFAPGMESEAGERMRFIGEISAALAADEFELYYQPHLDLASRSAVGAEALIRWHHPTRGMLLPDAFIPFAERNGLIGAMSCWVIDHAIAMSQSFGKLVPSFRLYLNLSALDLSHLNVVERFQRASAAGVCLGNLGVEITETAAMQDIGVTTQIVKSLRALDVGVAIDDFGTGYSSFGLLKRLPVDIIKIDRSFVSEIQANPNDAAITETVIGISQRLGSATLGEGVETVGQQTWLREHGCDYAQGYLIAKPLPVDAFTAWLGAHNPGDPGASPEAHIA
jgi:diguanylate cyclase (GGDEF)-like protein